MARASRRSRADTASRGGRPDLEAALADPDDAVFFDAATTQMRAALLTRAIEAGKAVYCEKPVAEDFDSALAVARLARQRGIKSGVVQDKLFLPGLKKLAMLKESGFFGRILSLRGEFGYWVFEGDWQAAQRPSWNYRKADGGGIILDMLCHWRYVLDNLVGPVKAVSCIGATHIPSRVDERGQRYAADADDAAYATFEFEDGAIAQINSSWAVRVRRDDLVTFQIDGTHGSAVAGLSRCWTQHRVEYAAAGVEPGRAAEHRFLRHLGGGAGQRRLRQRLPDAVGDVHPPLGRRMRPGRSI